MRSLAISTPPAGERFQQEIATQDEVEAWLESGQFGLAVVCGAVSGNAELIDFDQAELFAPWRELVEAQAPGLADRLTVVKTPNGHHVWYRCTDTKIPGTRTSAAGRGAAAAGQ